MLLVGGNGAGKTTLLQILAGKHMVPQVWSSYFLACYVQMPGHLHGMLGTPAPYMYGANCSYGEDAH